MPEATPAPGLLPAGLTDLLPPDAEIEARSVSRLMKIFASHGYARVDPPLLEFEDSLLAGSGAAIADQIFRLLDPDSHRMMGVRADLTPQVARIAATRLRHAPRPLRLATAGACLRTRGGQTDPGRQVSQVGIELIGADGVTADAEPILLAAEALAAIGLERISIDLTLPTLTGALLAGHPAADTLARAIDRKDMAEIGAHGGSAAPLLTALLRTAGPAGPAIVALLAAGLPPALQPLAERLAALTAMLASRAPALRLTIDPLDGRGMRYHTGIAFTIYAPGRHEPLGRGGRYRSSEDEAATGLTLYADAVLRAAPRRHAAPLVFVPLGEDPHLAASLRARGYATVAGLEVCDDICREAARLGCGYLVRSGNVETISREQGALPPDPAKGRRNLETLS